MRITERQLRRVIRETISDEFRSRLLARKKHYDDLAKQPLHYDAGDTVTVGKPWTGTVHGVPVIIMPGTKLEVLKLKSTTDGDFTLLVPAILQVPETAVRLMRLSEDTLEVEPGEIIRIQGAQLRNTQMDLPGGWELLRESAMNPRAAARRGIELRVKKRENFIEISAHTSGGARVGFLSSTENDDPCNGAWEIDGAESKINGLGPLLYDLMIDLVHPHPLMSDRAEVSDDARRVWDYYRDRRGDIESIQLDDLDNTLTPVEDDNCEQSSAMIWSDDNFGDEDSWPDSSLSKAYRRAAPGTPILDELQELGLVSFI